MSDDGKFVAGYGGQDVWLYGVGGERAERVPVQGVSGTIQGIDLSADSSMIAVVGEHDSVALWDIGSGAQVQADLATDALQSDWHDVTLLGMTRTS